MKNKKQRGGQRSNSGRKPVEDKKIPITVYITQSTIEGLGGMDKARDIARNAVEAEEWHRHVRKLPGIKKYG